MINEKQFTLHGETQKKACIEYISGLSLEELYEVIIREHDPARTLPQNSFSHAIYTEIARAKGDETPEEIKCYCKLHFGLSLLAASNNKEIAKQYSDLLATLEPLSYEYQLKLMRSIPVTSKMTKSQAVEYTEQVLRHFNIGE